MKSRSLLAVLCFLIACGPHYRRLTQPARYSKKTPETYKARFETTKGVFVVEVTRASAPLGADRFYNLVHGGFYDGARFFRTLPKFVVQFGINPNPAVSKAWGDATKIKDDPVKESNQRGAVTFAMAGPDTRTTQVFINMRDNARLDKMGFAPIGKVISGMDVMEKLFADYGEGPPRGKGPDQDKIEAEGEAYLAREFPKLDKIVRARIVK